MLEQVIGARKRAQEKRLSVLRNWSNVNLGLWWELKEPKGPKGF